MQSLTPDDVQRAIFEAQIHTEIITFRDSTATAQQAADNIGCELGQIVKSLAFLINGEPILVLVSGDQVAHDRKIADVFGVGRKKVRMANAQQCIEIYGYAPGGVPPLGHRTPNIPVYIDENFQRYDLLYAAAGSANTIFPITCAELVKVTQGKFALVTKD